MKVAIDLDDTLWDFFGALIGQPNCPPLTHADHVHWDGLPDLLGGEERAQELFRGAFTGRSLLASGLFDEAEEAFAWLQGRGLDLVVLSHRPAWSISEATEALRELGLHAPLVGCSSSQKVSYCFAHGVDALVDDHPHTQREAADAGLPVFSFRYPYNTHVDGVRFVSGWWELARLLVALQREPVSLAS